MKKNNILFISIFFLLISCRKETIELMEPVSDETFIANNTGLSPVELLGKRLFFDTTLSTPIGKSCASCHAPSAAFSDPKHEAFSIGSTGLKGKRNAPSIAYLAFQPDMFYNAMDGTWMGGFFVDGREPTLSAQAGVPMLEEREMNNGSKDVVVNKVKNASYRDLFVSVFGDFTNDSIDFNKITLAIEAFEKSKQVNTFSSKYDYFISGKTELTQQEMRGLNVFVNSKKGNCAACHPLDPDALYNKVLLTDFSYDNVGVPTNPNQAFGVPDLGLGITKSDANENGKFKVPSLRNVAVTAPYFHNGIFATLEEAVQFYNERDSNPKFSTPEVAQNKNTDELGDLKLSTQEVNDLVAFLKTLTDGYTVK